MNQESTKFPEYPAIAATREGIDKVIAFYCERELPEHIEAKPYRATLCYAASTCLVSGGEYARIHEAADALIRGRDEIGAAWFDWDNVYRAARRGGLDAVLALAGGDPWGFLAGRS